MLKHSIFILLFLFAVLPETAGQKNSHNNISKGAFFEKIYEPRRKVIQGDTIYIRSRWFFPRHAKVQYAGSVGFFSIGAGYRFWDIYEPTLTYGLLSPSFGGSNITVHTVSIKNSFDLTQNPWLNRFHPKAGMLLNLGYTNNTFHKLPPHYPEKYYFQNKIHIAPFWGGEWYFPLKDKHLDGIGLYFEFSALDAYLFEAIRTKYLTILDVWSLGLGMTFYFR